MAIGVSYARSNHPALSSSIDKPVSAAPNDQAKIDLPLRWPDYGQAAYGAPDKDILAVSDDSAQPVPVASLAKVITALAILKKKPLQPGQQGPMITITEADEQSYRDYLAKNGTVVPVKIGEQISEYQALEAMLLPSGNNIADSLARWAFGSVDDYNIYANDMLKNLDISNTIVADASGYSPLTKSTAADMVQLGILYIRDPVLLEIASQTETNIPFAGIIQNYNSTINGDGILGLKIGYTDEAGRSFLVADIRGSDNKEVSVVAVIGADNLQKAMKDAKRLLQTGNSAHDLLPDSSN
jgi:D-alanyl-D-alanine carboxypeptidase (penicillin-binding protein 5/6)